MNHPKIHIWVTPSGEYIEKNINGNIRKIHTIPDNEKVALNNLRDKGYTPFIHANKKITDKNEIEHLSGVVFSLFDGYACRISEWHGEPIFGLVYFQDPLSDQELDVVLAYFSEFFNIPTERRLLTRRFKRIVDMGCLEPPKAFRPIESSNTV